MIHYHVWFDLKVGVTEPEGIGAVREFLAEVGGVNELRGFRMMRNRGGPRTKLAAYHALIEFEDDGQLARAMRQQEHRGIRTGRHGRVVGLVASFHVEIFEELTEARATEVAGACLI
jgi:hypothetical protein